MKKLPLFSHSDIWLTPVDHHLLHYYSYFTVSYFRHDVGSGPVEVRSDERLTMNQWNKIRIVRRGNTADFSVDTTTARNKRSITPSSILNVDDRVYLGGLEARKGRYSH
jgi:hypothetical protein